MGGYRSIPSPEREHLLLDDGSFRDTPPFFSTKMIGQSDKQPLSASREPVHDPSVPPRAGVSTGGDKAILKQQQKKKKKKKKKNGLSAKEPGRRTRKRPFLRTESNIDVDENPKNDSETERGSIAPKSPRPTSKPHKFFGDSRIASFRAIIRKEKSATLCCSISVSTKWHHSLLNSQTSD